MAEQATGPWHSHRWLQHLVRGLGRAGKRHPDQYQRDGQHRLPEDDPRDRQRVHREGRLTEVSLGKVAVAVVAQWVKHSELRSLKDVQLK